MASRDDTVTVSVVTERAPVIIECPTRTFTAEQLCIILCKKYNIPPLTRTLFALRIKGSRYFLKDNCEVLSSSRDYELRIRFKVPRLGLLMSLDEVTFDYYFQQARIDINDNQVSEIRYPDHKQELLGLGITDMCRAITEEKLSMNEVVRNCKKYIPKIINKRHGPFPKRHANYYLPKLFEMHYSVNYLKDKYMVQLYGLAPNYLAEEYENVLWLNADNIVPVRLVVAPFHPQQPGIRLYDTNKGEWMQVCTIEGLIYLMRNGNCTLEVSRRGTPLFFKFKSDDQLSSFISVCDGYYRLMVKWTFNLSKDDETPSLKELQEIKCHGPVGGAFSYRKLEEKRAKKHGCYILRQCQDDYNIYYLDVCTKTRTTETYKIEFKGHCYMFNNNEYYDIHAIIRSHQDPEKKIFLNECVPPSEFDQSQLLLCGEPVKKGVRIDQTELQEVLKTNKSPRCLLNKDIMLFIGSEKVGSGNITVTYKAHWNLDETKKLIVAFKALQRDDHLKEFIELASKYVCVHSSCVVRLYGVTLNSPTALVLEYVPYGPLDDYLKKHGDKVKPLHLKKVAAMLARALWDLSEAGLIHGYIRCKRLLLAACDADRIVVKLSGPSLRPYTPIDIHWMPVEFFPDMNLAKRSAVGDIWAFATTLWEVFSYGVSPAETNPVLTEKSYELGDRLLRPTHCPGEVWALLAQCWRASPMRPQEIMRDINHMLHREYVPIHEYEEPKICLNHPMDTTDTVSSDRFAPSELSDASSNKSLISDSSAPSLNGTLVNHFENHFPNNNKLASSLEGMSSVALALRSSSSLRSASASAPLADDPGEQFVAGGQPRRMQPIVTRGSTYFVTLTKRIGSGNYGEVYRGWMEWDTDERLEVAIKKLTKQAHAIDKDSTLYIDFKNELEIMKSLNHNNIVNILGYSWKPDVMIVMEYLEEGSLNYYLKFQGDKLSITHLLIYARDIATGMEYVSRKNIVHRDLATRNILVVDKYHVKISDFGLARAIPKDDDKYKLKTERLLPINWYAPESASDPWMFSTKSDVWSFGVTAWEIFTRATQEVPKFDMTRPKERASCFQIPDDCPSEIYRYLMTDCWNLEPNRRPTFTELKIKAKRFLEDYDQGT
ncbi:tyrosine-protein kinase hopscotch [Ostrinia nubilalis]|uniref:tyrosine-protein kinase hopscotch n=1 Tax=Ostrinia nubilalis TaxID=29057 RepID=UPI0030824ED0